MNNPVTDNSAFCGDNALTCLCIDKRTDLAALSPKTLLCVGGSRSGKSDFALAFAQRFPGKKAFVATMQKYFAAEDGHSPNAVQDPEVAKRIEKHQKQRDASWITIEEPFNLIRAAELAKKQNCAIILIDCISLWLSNLILAGKSEEEILRQAEELADALKTAEIPIACVSGEVGCGTVPMHAQTRLFKDVQGKTNQILAASCQAVVTVMYGIPILLKG